MFHGRSSFSQLVVLGLVGGAVALVAACTSSDSASGGGTDAGAEGATGSEAGSVDGGGEAGADGAAASPDAIACDAYHDAVTAAEVTCMFGSPNPPADIAATLKARARKLCLATLALPGMGVTAQTYLDCAKVLTDGIKASCAILDSNALTGCFDKKGSLADGTPCHTGAQCTGGLCTHPNTSVPGGISLDTSTCNITNGTCHTGVAVGQACNLDTGIACAFGSDCVTNVCVANGSVDVGGDCNTNTSANCKDGLACSAGKCVTPGGANDPCAGSGSCQPAFVCNMNVCTAGLANGADCSTTPDLCLGLCNPATQKCGPPVTTLARPGEACGLLSGGVVSCVSGACLGSPGKCRTVIPDGQPCTIGDKTSTCDYLANCNQGVCVLDTPVCR